ncbi:pirin family protein [Micromonospora sp. KC207]|uniref:pirin family protein n=1 Tax=Micromonospora sp. KC207 TaxID=2530377 RepID=UPI001043F2CE|nr:pirin family protein [Micromonospora sp. KC207]TDC66838.1 pirin family protein [Micromonospora sp. KC207]
MDRTESLPAQTRPPGVTPADPGSVLLPGHDVPLGRYTTVRRLLPQRQRRMVGAWCFVDHFGPDDVAERPGMEVPPHPHTGLQTVTWLLDGEIVHRDSLGNVQPIRPGQLNVMTSGHGITHSERSPAAHPPVMHGAQLWVALPDPARAGGADFAHHEDLPVWRDGDADVTLLVGEFAGERSPAVVHTPLLGAQLTVRGAAPVRLPLRRDFEYALLAMSGCAEVGDVPLKPGALLYLGLGRESVALAGVPGSRLLLLGGEPFEEPLVTWWNFVGRSHEEIAVAREDWTAGRRFGVVADDAAPPLPAPALPTTRLLARTRHGEILR